MTFIDISDIKITGGTFYLNSPDFKGTELLFTDSNPELYIVIMRREGTYSDVADIIENTKMIGIYNGIDYDYRIDLNNYIRITYPSFELSSYDGQITEYIGDNDKVQYYGSLKNTVCELYLAIDPTDFTNLGTKFKSYTQTKSNGDKFLWVYDLNTNEAIDGIDTYFNYVFKSYNNQFIEGFSYPDRTYLNSYFLLNINELIDFYVDFVSFYNQNNNLIIRFSRDYNSSSGITFVLYPVPQDAFKVVVTYKLNGSSSSKSIYIDQLYSKHQYFYYGIDDPIETVYFTGKRETVEEYQKRNIRFGKQNRTLNIKVRDKFTQNTGLDWDATQLFSLFKSPTTFTFSGTSITEWTIDEAYIETYHTKSYGNRNTVINLTKSKERNRYTGFDSGFFT